MATSNRRDVYQLTYWSMSEAVEPHLRSTCGCRSYARDNGFANARPVPEMIIWGKIAHPY